MVTVSLGRASPMSPSARSGYHKLLTLLSPLVFGMSLAAVICGCRIALVDRNIDLQVVDCKGNAVPNAIIINLSIASAPEMFLFWHWGYGYRSYRIEAREDGWIKGTLHRDYFWGDYLADGYISFICAPGFVPVLYRGQSIVMMLSNAEISAATLRTNGELLLNSAKSSGIQQCSMYLNVANIPEKREADSLMQLFARMKGDGRFIGTGYSGQYIILTGLNDVRFQAAYSLFGKDIFQEVDAGSYYWMPLSEFLKKRLSAQGVSE